MSQLPLLTICIPTFSRSHLLKECLDSIVGQFSDPEIYAQVEIAVSDNASTDNTENLVRSYQEKYTNISYNRNPSNLNFDRNVNAVLKLAKGKFCWLMSDDDLLQNNAFSFLLPILKSHPEVAYICVNHGGLQTDKEVMIFPNGDSWLGNLGLTGGLVSQNIFNKSLLPTDLSRYYGNEWLHFSIALEMIAKKPAMMIKKILQDPPEQRSCRWAAEGYVFMVYIALKKMLQDLPNFGYSKEIVNRLIEQLARGLPRRVASARLHDLSITWRGFKTLIVEFYNYPVQLFLAILVFFTPKHLIKFTKRLLVNIAPAKYFE